MKKDKLKKFDHTLKDIELPNEIKDLKYYTVGSIYKGIYLHAVLEKQSAIMCDLNVNVY